VTIDGFIGGSYLKPWLDAIFGDGHTAGFPNTFTLYLATSSWVPYSATATVPNDSGHWSWQDGTGYTNVARIVFSGLSSGDVSGWSNFGAVLLQDGSGNNVVDADYTGVAPGFTPTVGLKIVIPPFRLVFSANTVGTILP
jgi:hypothetical protein